MRPSTSSPVIARGCSTPAIRSSRRGKRHGAHAAAVPGRPGVRHGCRG
jgi:hypothetical protein